MGRVDYSHPIWNVFSPAAKDLITKMLTVDWRKRPTAAQCLQHPWFSQANQTPIDPAMFQGTLENMSRFNATQKLQQATMMMVVMNLTTKKEQAELQQVFDQLDTNKDGKLQYDELLQGFTHIHGATFAKDEVNRIFALVDSDHSGEIEFSEFVMATANRDKLLSQDKLSAAFRLFDKDGSGSIEANEIRQQIGVGNSIGEDVWEGVLSQVDKNGDG